jgi:hypothetical protein
MVSEADIRLLESIRWKSIDRDNMEFEARATCYQRDALHRILAMTEARENGDASR